MLTRSSSHAPHEHRHAAFGVGLVTMLLTAATAMALASGCIFDEGGYEGGGRRTSAPTPTETTPNMPSSPAKSAAPVTTPPVDSGTAEVDARDG